MSSKTIRVILIMMLITLGSLFVTQVYWFKKSFDLEERQLDEKINITLRNVADGLLKLNADSTSRIAPISKISSNEYFVETKTRFGLNTLDSVLRAEFSERNIDLNYDYLLVSSVDEVVVLGNTVLANVIPGEVACKSRTDEGEILNFKIRINDKTTYLINTMGIWLFSSIALLTLLAVFTFIIISIIKGKNLALLKREFVNNMTHELKTPIANISVASDAIRNNKINMDEEKLKKYADIIYSENERLHNLVDRVLQISEIEKKNQSMLIEQCNLHELIHHANANFQPLVVKTGGSIKLDLKATHSTLKGDKLHLSNVIYNLIDNAIKYSIPPLKIEITTQNKKNGIQIQVKDNGIGISKENQLRIFEKFFRAESGDIQNTKGYGLGLSYVKLIVEKHNGTITFSSTENVGSTFNIFLPQ